MHRLNLLGQALLQRESGSTDGPASRPRPLALLALLAASGPLGLARDKCLVYLWPESDTRRARNSLHQTLHAIRTDLGPDIIDSGPPLRLQPDQISVDLWEFEDALAAGDIDAAISLYAGPFLDGFTVEDLPELEEWIAGERLRISRRYAAALEQSAKGASERSDHAHAIQQWRARAQLDPLSAPPTLGLMRALVAAGDRASAIATGDAYKDLVHRELASAPDPTITNLVAELRAQPASRLLPSSIRMTRSPSPGPALASGGAYATAADQHDVALPVDPVFKEYKRRLRNARVSAVLAWSMFFGLLLHKWAQETPTVPRSPERIAVFPFTVSGTAESQYLGNGLVDLISTSLDGAGSIRGVDPRALLQWLESNQLTAPSPREAAAVANRFGAGRFVLGSVTESGSRLRILASLYRQDAPDSAMGSAVIEGDATDLFRLVDQATSQLLAASLGEPRHRLMQVAALTTPSLPALKHYLAGEQALRAGNYVEAADALQRAVEIDSGFALAHYRLALAADWLGRDSLARAAGEAALSRAERLSAHDSLLVDAALTARRGNLPAAERLYRAIVADYPDDIEAWSQLGDLLFQGNPLRGRSVVEARDAFTRVLSLDPDDAEALMHLARIAYLEGDQIAVDSLGQRLTRGAASGEVLELRAFRAFALSDRDSWKSVTRELRDHPPNVAAVTALEVALYLDDVDGTERFATMLRDRRYSNAIRGLGHRMLARTAAARGQWRVARAQLDSARRFDAVSTLELRALLASLDFLDVPVDEVREIRSEVQRWNAAAADGSANEHSTVHVGLHGGLRAYRLGLLSARLADTNAVSAQADTIERLATGAVGRAASTLNTMAHSLRARTAFARGDAAEALRHLDQAGWLSIQSGFEEEAGDRYLRALVLTALGRDDEAINWFRTIAQRGTHELVYLAPSRLRESMLACNARDHRAAALAYASAARLWSQAAASLREEVDSTGKQLQSLGVVLSAATSR